MKEKNTGVLRLVLRVLQGMLIGVGAVLPGISGGVLCVVFGIYKPIMELLSSPIKKCKTHVPRLLPVIVGAVLGFLGVAKVLAFFLERYPDPSVCLFVGLIAGMLPSLFREAGEQGRTRGSWISLVADFAVVLALLLSLNVLSVTIAPSFGWYLFCGFCMALSIIAPGMSFSTLLMPLGLYTPLVDGIGNLDFGVLVPAGIGALVTIVCLAKAINALFTHFYSCAFHAIVGIVIAATLFIIPFGSFTPGGGTAVANICAVGVGGVAALAWVKSTRGCPKEAYNPPLKKWGPPRVWGGPFLRLFPCFSIVGLYGQTLQVPPDHVQGLAGGAVAVPLPALGAANGVALCHPGVLPVGEGNVNQPHGLFGGAAIGPGNAGDAHAQAAAGAPHNALGHLPGGLGADSPVLLQRLVGDGEQILLGLVGVGDHPHVEHLRGAGHIGQPLGQQAAGAAFGGG